MAPRVPASGGRRAVPFVPLALTLLVTLMLPVTACGGGDTPAVPTGPATAPGSHAAASGSGSPSAAPGAASPSTATAGPTAAEGLPGQAFEGGPRPGPGLAVLGVAAGSTLTVQNLPGPTAPGAATVTTPRKLTVLSPVATEIRATGRSRLVRSASGSVPATVWTEITTNGVTGWVDAGHVAFAAAATDATAEVLTHLGGHPVVEETMLDLGQAVAKAYVSDEPPSTVTVTVTPTVGDLGEITLDVVGIGDDSVAGLRLHVLGTPGEESFTLKSVEATAFCQRGVSGGRCI